MNAIITMTKDQSSATAITHGGIFHADEVFGTVILSKVMENISIARVFKVAEDANPEAVVFDIGSGRFDHHQKGGNGVRENGIPYAACGLLWKEYGMQICANTANPERAFAMIDARLIAGIDANDNGYGERSDTAGMSVSAVISGFNPRWNENETPDEKFLKAVEMAETIFDNTFKSVACTLEAESVVEDAIEKSEDDIVVLEHFVPWQGSLLHSRNPKAATAKFMVFPSIRGGWNWQGIPIDSTTRDLRKPCPSNWNGLKDEELQKASGVKTATFVHQAGFIGGCKTLDDTIKMAKEAIAAA